jgi:branched-chain amino acid transport system ATP-binding protein
VPEPLLQVQQVQAGYGAVTVLWDVGLDVQEGEVVAILGANGAGKTSLLRTIVNQITTSGGEIQFGGVSTRGMRPDALARQGLVLVPEGRGLIPFMSVEENLRLGQDAGGRGGAELRPEIDRMFPVLGARSKQLAGDLSGGEQQMLAIARALLMRPRCLMLDEPSQGLAPRIVNDIFQLFGQIRERLDQTLVIVEQNVRQALAISDRAYVLERGRVVLSGGALELRSNPQIRDAYLGGSVHGPEVG